MTFKEFTGKNVEEAIRSAMREFDAELSELDIEILAQGSRGMLGVGREEARILAAPKALVAAADTVRLAPERPPAEATEAAQAAAAPGETEEAPPEPVREGDNGERRRRRRGGRGRGRRAEGEPARERGERVALAERPEERREEREERREEPVPFVPAKPMEELSEKERAVLEDSKTVLSELLRLMGLEATVEVGTGMETAKLNVRGSELGVLIGRRGEKLAALQHVVNLIVAKRQGRSHRVAVDVENYRGRREDQLRDVAERAATRVTESGKIIQLEAMPPVERRIVHIALRDNDKVRTQSVGSEPNRRVVILPATQTKG
jgi:spoIIIJ-associated protein